MFSHHLLIVVLPLVSSSTSSQSLAGVGEEPGAPSAPRSAGLPIAVHWGDWNGDGLDDALVLPRGGSLQLLANLGRGEFEDVTERAGLAGLELPSSAAFADFDGDGRMDLFVGSAEHRARLFRNRGVEPFEDQSHMLGTPELCGVLQAGWVDLEHDGSPDLVLHTAKAHVLARNLGRGKFVMSELPFAPSATDAPIGDRGTGGPPSDPLGAPTRRPLPAPAGGLPHSGPSPAGPGTSAASTPGIIVTPLGSTPTAAAALPNCVDSIVDQASGITCLQASSTPTLGMLHPLGADFSIDLNGNIGIGTVSPSARVDVWGGVLKVHGSSGARFYRAGDDNLGLEVGGGSLASTIQFYEAGNTRSRVYSDGTGTHWEIQQGTLDITQGAQVRHSFAGASGKAGFGLTEGVGIGAIPNGDFFGVYKETRVGPALGTDRITIEHTQGRIEFDNPAAEPALVFEGDGNPQHDPKVALAVRDSANTDKVTIRRDGQIDLRPSGAEPKGIVSHRASDGAAGLRLGGGTEANEVELLYGGVRKGTIKTDAQGVVLDLASTGSLVASTFRVQGGATSVSELVFADGSTQTTSTDTNTTVQDLEDEVTFLAAEVGPGGALRDRTDDAIAALGIDGLPGIDFPDGSLFTQLYGVNGIHPLLDEHESIVGYMDFAAGRLRFNAPIELPNPLLFGTGPTPPSLGLGLTGFLEFTGGAGLALVNGLDSMQMHVAPGAGATITAPKLNLANASGSMTFETLPGGIGKLTVPQFRVANASGVMGIEITPGGTSRVTGPRFEVANASGVMGIEITPTGSGRVTTPKFEVLDASGVMGIEITPGTSTKIRAPLVQFDDGAGHVANMRPTGSSPTNPGLRFDGYIDLRNALGTNSTVLSNIAPNVMKLKGSLNVEHPTLSHAVQLNVRPPGTGLLGSTEPELEIASGSVIVRNALGQEGAVGLAATGSAGSNQEALHVAGLISRVTNTPSMTAFGLYSEVDGDGLNAYGLYATVANSTATSNKFGVFGQGGAAGTGLYGNTSNAGKYGVIGNNDGAQGGTGVWGISQSSLESDLNRGVYGQSRGQFGSGVYGDGWALWGATVTYGVRGHSFGSNGYGVYGRAESTTGVNYGVWGQSESPDGFGVYSADDAYVNGTVGSGVSALTIQANSGGTGYQSGLRLWGTEGTYDYGARLNFGDGQFAYIWEDQDDDLRVRGDTRFEDNVTINGTTTSTTFELDVNGQIRCIGSVDTTSDQRLKTGIQDLEGALDKVLALRGVSFEWDRAARPAAPEGRQIGFLAQQVREVLPEIVTEGDDGYLSVAYAAVVPVLVEALQEQERRIQSLETQVRSLTGSAPTSAVVLERPPADAVREPAAPPVIVPARSAYEGDLAAEVARMRDALAALEARIAMREREEPPVVLGDSVSHVQPTRESSRAGLETKDEPVKGAPLPQKELAARAAALQSMPGSGGTNSIGAGTAPLDGARPETPRPPDVHIVTPPRSDRPRDHK